MLDMPCRFCAAIFARDQNKPWTQQQGISADQAPPPVLITSYCYGYLHAEAWALSKAF